MLYLNHDQLPSQKKTNMTSCFLFLQPSLLALQKLWQDSRLTHMRKTSLLTSLCVLCIRVQQGLLRYMRMVWVGSNASLQVCNTKSYMFSIALQSVVTPDLQLLTNELSSFFFFGFTLPLTNLFSSM